MPSGTLKAPNGVQLKRLNTYLRFTSMNSMDLIDRFRIKVPNRHVCVLYLLQF